MKKLNAIGASHILALMLVIVTIGIGGSYLLITSHADSCTGTSSPTSDATSSPVSDPNCGATSQPVSEPNPLPEVEVPRPVIDGTLKVEGTLIANEGTGHATAGTTRSVQWYAANVAINGATKASYVLQPAQVGKTITVTVTASKAGYTPVTVESAPTAVVAPGTLYISTPQLSGSTTKSVGYYPQVGNTFAVYLNTLSTTGLTLKYQWYSNNVAISGATAATYKLPAGQLNKTVSAAVTASKPGYTPLTQKTLGSKIGIGTLKAGKPTVSGTAKVGKTLTASPGAWTSGTSFKYQWYQGGSTIKKATGKTFKITKAQKDWKISVEVTGSQAGYKSATTYSKDTATVK